LSILNETWTWGLLGRAWRAFQFSNREQDRNQPRPAQSAFVLNPSIRFASTEFSPTIETLYHMEHLYN
jgi:hypothetical protein